MRGLGNRLLRGSGGEPLSRGGASAEGEGARAERAKAGIRAGHGGDRGLSPKPETWHRRRIQASTSDRPPMGGKCSTSRYAAGPHLDGLIVLNASD